MRLGLICAQLLTERDQLCLLLHSGIDRRRAAARSRLGPGAGADRQQFVRSLRRDQSIAQSARNFDKLRSCISRQKRCLPAQSGGRSRRSQAGVASKAFKALSENDVNIQIICTSEIKITMVIDEALVDKAVNVLHEEFELEK